MSAFFFGAASASTLVYSVVTLLDLSAPSRVFAIYALVVTVAALTLRFRDGR